MLYAVSEKWHTQQLSVLVTEFFGLVVAGIAVFQKSFSSVQLGHNHMGVPFTLRLRLVLHES